MDVLARVKYRSDRGRSDVAAGTLMVSVTLPASLLATQMYIPNSPLSAAASGVRIDSVPSFSGPADASSRAGSDASTSGSGWR